jgi:diguanylate cyclase (GGDEF)-like protein
MALFVAFAEALVMLLLAQVGELPPLVEAAVDASLLTLLVAPGLWLLFLRPLERHLAEAARSLEEKAREARERERERVFEAKARRAFEISQTEEQVLETAARAMRAAFQAPSELLLADSSHAHLRRAVAAGLSGSGCAVPTPSDCLAAREGRTLRFPSSQDLDACPYLRDRPQGACSAVCSPISIAGRAVGVLHVVGEEGSPPQGSELERLRVVGAQVGQRLTMVRALAESQLQAATDPLTGLANRRMLEERARALQARGAPFAVVLADLDRFKELNDRYGHEAGDHALRLFAGVLREVARDEDTVARYGGEEFAVLLPEAGAEAGLQYGRRVRERLASRLASTTLPPFTASLGVAESACAESWTGVLRCADEALYRAKQEGRNRVRVLAPRAAAAEAGEVVADEDGAGALALAG